MPYYRRVGDVPRKRHLRVPHPSGDGYLFEELMGENGFSQESALLYHLHSPSAIVHAERVADPRQCALETDVPLVARHLRTSKLAPGGDPVLGRVRLLANSDVEISWAGAERDSDLYRNALGDELIYVQSGGATLESSFGSLELSAGDFCVVPTGTTHRWRVAAGGVQALVLEATGHIGFPAKYLTGRGQLLEGAPFSERDLRAPEEPLVVEGGDVPVIVRTVGGLTRHVHLHHPFDVIGWDGGLYPFALSIHDFEPIVGA